MSGEKSSHANSIPEFARADSASASPYRSGEGDVVVVSGGGGSSYLRRGTRGEHASTYSYLLPRNISAASTDVYPRRRIPEGIAFHPSRIPPCRGGDIESVSSFASMLVNTSPALSLSRPSVFKPESQKRMGNREIGRAGERERKRKSEMACSSIFWGIETTPRARPS